VWSNKQARHCNKYFSTTIIIIIHSENNNKVVHEPVPLFYYLYMLVRFWLSLLNSPYGEDVLCNFEGHKFLLFHQVHLGFSLFQGPLRATSICNYEEHYHYSTIRIIRVTFFNAILNTCRVYFD
jgi:hypothetical protein